MNIYEQTWIELIKTHVEKRIKTIEASLQTEDIQEWWGDYWQSVNTYKLQRKSEFGDAFDSSQWDKYLHQILWNKDDKDNGLAAYNTLWEIVLRSSLTSHAQFESVALMRLSGALNQLEQGVINSNQFRSEAVAITLYVVSESNLWADKHPNEYRVNITKFP